MLQMTEVPDPNSEGEKPQLPAAPAEASAPLASEIAKSFGRGIGSIVPISENVSERQEALLAEVAFGSEGTWEDKMDFLRRELAFTADMAKKSKPEVLRTLGPLLNLHGYAFLRNRNGIDMAKAPEVLSL